MDLPAGGADQLNLASHYVCNLIFKGCRIWGTGGRRTMSAATAAFPESGRRKVCGLWHAGTITRAERLAGRRPRHDLPPCPRVGLAVIWLDLWTVEPNWPSWPS
jgi:hypothetical protein